MAGVFSWEGVGFLFVEGCGLLLLRGFCSEYAEAYVSRGNAPMMCRHNAMNGSRYLDVPGAWSLFLVAVDKTALSCYWWLLV